MKLQHYYNYADINNLLIDAHIQDIDVMSSFRIQGLILYIRQLRYILYIIYSVTLKIFGLPKTHVRNCESCMKRLVGTLLTKDMVETFDDHIQEVKNGAVRGFQNSIIYHSLPILFSIES